MASATSFFPRILLATGVTTGIFLAPAIAAAQGAGCADPGPEHAGETPIFTGSDHDNRVFTLTQSKKTGAWTLVVIGEFERDEGGLEIGKPCVVAEGQDSKLLDIPSPTGSEATIAVASAETGTETSAGDEVDAATFRVTQALDIRTGPGTDFDSIAQVPFDGSGVAVAAESCKEVSGYLHSWCEVAWEGHKGWASACCLESERTGLRLE